MIAEQGWRPAAGERVALIGPLTVDADTPYTARYQEAVIPAGFRTVSEPGIDIRDRRRGTWWRVHNASKHPTAC